MNRPEMAATQGLGAAIHERVAGASLIGRGGAPGVGHRLTSPRRRRLVARAAAALVAVSAATAGAVLLLSPPEVTIMLSAAQYRVGDATLSRVAADQYRGQGALQLTRQPDGTVLAAGDATVNAQHVTGQCLEDADRRTERCVFDIAGSGLGALDTWSSGTWHRRYDDGRTATMTSTTPAPVPFPVGR